MSNSSPLIPPSPVTDIDLEAGPSQQIQCRICLEIDGIYVEASLWSLIFKSIIMLFSLCICLLLSGTDFIAPCKCRGTSKYVHRECLDHWRAVKVKDAVSV